MRKLEIVNLYKHNIVHKNVKNRQPKLFLYSLLMCIVSIMTFVYLSSVNSGIKESTSVFNPISELYRDVEVASFVSANSNFIVPVKTDKYTINLNSIDFTITSSIMIFSPANGVVDSIYGEDVKVIKIKHSDALYSIIKNVNIVGVKVGDKIKQGKEIATAKVGDIVTLMIENDGTLVEGLHLNKSFIKWETN